MKRFELKEDQMHYLMLGFSEEAAGKLVEIARKRNCPVEEILRLGVGLVNICSSSEDCKERIIRTDMEGIALAEIILPPSPQPFKEPHWQENRVCEEKAGLASHGIVGTMIEDPDLGIE